MGKLRMFGVPVQASVSRPGMDSACQRCEQSFDDLFLTGESRVQSVGEQQVGIGRITERGLQVDRGVSGLIADDVGDGVQIAVAPHH